MEDPTHTLVAAAEVPERLITIEELQQQHNREGDVWMCIGGKVYDFTAFSKGEHGGHPGGKGVLVAYAGTDGTAEWDFIGHSTYATMIGDKYCIGQMDMSSESARMRQALGGERPSRKAATETLRGTVKTDTGNWAIHNRVEQKRNEQYTFDAFKKMDQRRKRKEFTMEEINMHNKEDDCWIVIGGNVYDVTTFMMKHPGGKASLLSVAGNEATVKFESIHEDGILESYAGQLFVGLLKKADPAPKTVPQLTAANTAAASRVSKIMAHVQPLRCPAGAQEERGRRGMRGGMRLARLFVFSALHGAHGDY